MAILHLPEKTLVEFFRIKVFKNGTGNPAYNADGRHALEVWGKPVTPQTFLTQE